MAKTKLTVEKKTKGATICRTQNGKKVVLLTPSGRFERYGRELSSGRSHRTGEPLSDWQIGYKKGYRAALGEQAKIHNKKNFN